MIIFPPEFRRTKYPGYVFNTATKELFTFKSGTLKRLVSSIVSRVKFFHKAPINTKFQTCYRISVDGRRRLVLMEELLNIAPIAYDMIEVKTVAEKHWSIFKGGSFTLSKLYGYGREVQWYNESTEMWESLPPPKSAEFDSSTGIYWRVSNENYTFRASN